MASFCLENFSNIELFEKESPQGFCCQICGNLMKSPLQTYRGNVACFACYREAEKTNTGICPIDKEPIQSKHVFKDKAKEKEILNLYCYCLNKAKGCDWTGTIRDLQKHECKYEPIPCSLCGQLIMQKDETQHRINECSCIIREGDCFYKESGCSFKATTKEEMADHMVMNQVQHATSMEDLKKYTELQDKYKEVEKDNKRLQGNVDVLNQKLEESEKQTANTTAQIAQLRESLLQLSKRIPRKAEGNQESLKIEVVDSKVENKIKEISNVAKNNAVNITDVELRLQLHENTTYNGHLVWKIDNFAKRRKEAIEGRITALHSAPCFTSQYGYKFCLRLYLNGDGMGKGSHMSLFLVIMKSEYDNILEWPFKKQVKFTLINQQNRFDDVVERMAPNKDSTSFQKPKKEMNIASGCPLFVEIDRLEKDGFIKDDSLFLDVQIL